MRHALIVAVPATPEGLALGSAPDGLHPVLASEPPESVSKGHVAPLLRFSRYGGRFPGKHLNLIDVLLECPDQS